MRGCSQGKGGMRGCSGGGACMVAPRGGACVVLVGEVHGCSRGGGRGCAWDTTRYGDTINERAVRILLECILVQLISHKARVLNT